MLKDQLLTFSINYAILLLQGYKGGFEMAYCINCGHCLEQDSKFCSQCGKETVYEQGENTGTYSGYTAPLPQQKPSIGSSIASMVFAILSLEMSIFCYIPVVFFVFTAISVAFICVARGQRNQYVSLAGKENVFTKVANICSIIAIPTTVIFSMVGFALTLAMFE